MLLPAKSHRTLSSVAFPAFVIMNESFTIPLFQLLYERQLLRGQILAHELGRLYPFDSSARAVPRCK